MRWGCRNRSTSRQDGIASSARVAEDADHSVDWPQHRETGVVSSFPGSIRARRSWRIRWSAFGLLAKLPDLLGRKPAPLFEIRDLSPSLYADFIISSQVTSRL